jgi:hypothetical protein
LAYVTFALGYYLTNNKWNKMKKPLKQIQNPLQSFFTDDKNKTVTLGFLNEKEVQEYAPGSFRRKWKLKEPYKIPLPGSKTWNLFISKICRRYNDVL